MKQQDIALVIMIVAIAGVLSFFVSKQLFSPKNHQQQAEVVQPITADFSKPDERYFNNQAFDPTQTITIGQSANPDPFSSQQQ